MAGAGGACAPRGTRPPPAPPPAAAAAATGPRRCPSGPHPRCGDIGPGREGPPRAPSPGPALPAGRALEDGGPRAGAPVPPTRRLPHLQCTRRGPAPTAALACSRASSTKASRELGASGTLWSGQVVNCSCFTLRSCCWAAWGWGGGPLSALILPPDPAGGLRHPAPRMLPSPPPASRGVCPLGVPRQGAPLPQEVTAREADGARGPEPSAAQAETSLLSRPWMTLSLPSASQPFHNHQPPGLAGGQRPRGELPLPRECPPLPLRAHTWCSWNSRVVHSSWGCSASRQMVTGPWVTGLESAGQ